MRQINWWSFVHRQIKQLVCIAATNWALAQLNQFMKWKCVATGVRAPFSRTDTKWNELQIDYFEWMTAAMGREPRTKQTMEVDEAKNYYWAKNNCRQHSGGVSATKFNLSVAEIDFSSRFFSFLHFWIFFLRRRCVCNRIQIQISCPLCVLRQKIEYFRQKKILFSCLFLHANHKFLLNHFWWFSFSESQRIRRVTENRLRKSIFLYSLLSAPKYSQRMF